MATWTDAQINDELAFLGLRTPGKPLPPEPERIVCDALLTAKARVKELVQQQLETNSLYERTRDERDSLIPVRDERDDLKGKLVEAQKLVKDAKTETATYMLQRDVAYAMVRELEVRVRTLQSKLDAAGAPKP